MADALVGKDGWLFLDNDSNRSVDQYTGKLLLTQRCLIQWHQFIDHAKGRCERTGRKYLFLIAPGKESVFPHLYPHKRGMLTPAHQLSFEMKQDRAVVYPATDLSHHTPPSYPKTDTHWNDYGAMLVSKLIAERFGLEFPAPEPESFERVERLLDLGNKVTPEIRETTIEHHRRPDADQVYNNLISNHGRLLVYERPQSKAGTLVIFGDSFTASMCKWLPLTFRRVINVHATDIDWSIVEKEKADYLVNEVTERFLNAAPQTVATFDIRPTIKRKIEASPPPLQAKQSALYKNYFGEEP